MGNRTSSATNPQVNANLVSCSPAVDVHDCCCESQEGQSESEPSAFMVLARWADTEEPCLTSSSGKHCDLRGGQSCSDKVANSSAVAVVAMQSNACSSSGHISLPSSSPRLAPTLLGGSALSEETASARRGCISTSEYANVATAVQPARLRTPPLPPPAAPAPFPRSSSSSNATLSERPSSRLPTSMSTVQNAQNPTNFGTSFSRQPFGSITHLENMSDSEDEWDPGEELFPMLTTWNLPQDGTTRPLAGLWRASPVTRPGENGASGGFPVIQKQYERPQQQSISESASFGSVSARESAVLCGIGGLCSNSRSSTAKLVEESPAAMSKYRHVNV